MHCRENFDFHLRYEDQWPMNFSTVNHSVFVFHRQFQFLFEMKQKKMKSKNSENHIKHIIEMRFIKNRFRQKRKVWRQIGVRTMRAGTAIFSTKRFVFQSILIQTSSILQFDDCRMTCTLPCLVSSSNRNEKYP